MLKDQQIAQREILNISPKTIIQPHFDYCINGCEHAPGIRIVKIQRILLRPGAL